MVKVCFLHKNVRDISSMLRYLMLDSSIETSLVWDEETPDILFASEWIYYRSDIFRKFRRLYDKAGLKVAFWGEALEPDFNLFDYCVGFDDGLENDPGFIRLPSPFDMFKAFVGKRVNPITDLESAKAELVKKTGFCSFLYSNPMANPMRDKLFHEISKYKRVDSLGRHLNNVSTPGTGFSGHRDECVPIKAPYKFSISSENSDFRGYTSEKVLTSLEAHSIPIYWGNPNISDDINPECFIDFGKMSGFEELISTIRRIDEDDDMWLEIVSRPWLTPSQEVAHKERTDKYVTKMLDILSGNVSTRLAQGFHSYLYRDRFFSGRFPFDTRKDRIKKLFIK